MAKEEGRPDHELHSGQRQRPDCISRREKGLSTPPQRLHLTGSCLRRSSPLMARSGMYSTPRGAAMASAAAADSGHTCHESLTPLVFSSSPKLLPGPGWGAVAFGGGACVPTTTCGTRDCCASEASESGTGSRAPCIFDCEVDSPEPGGHGRRKPSGALMPPGGTGGCHSPTPGRICCGPLNCKLVSAPPRHRSELTTGSPGLRDDAAWQTTDTTTSIFEKIFEFRGGAPEFRGWGWSPL